MRHDVMISEILPMYMRMHLRHYTGNFSVYKCVLSLSLSLRRRLSLHSRPRIVLLKTWRCSCICCSLLIDLLQK